MHFKVVALSSEWIRTNATLQTCLNHLIDTVLLNLPSQGHKHITELKDMNPFRYTIPPPNNKQNHVKAPYTVKFEVKMFVFVFCY